MASRVTPLRIALLESGLSQRELALKIGKHEATVSRIFSGLHCDHETKLAIATALDSTVEQLWPTDLEAEAA